MRTSVLLCLASITISCVEVTEPPCPVAEVTQTCSESSLECHNCKDMVGRVYRITRMVIDEPDAFAQLLNTMWESDINNNILNVLIRVDNVKPGISAAFDSIDITAGPAWRVPKMPYMVPADPGQPMHEPITSYCFLKGLSFQMKVVDFRGYQCMLINKEPQQLFFHSGPKDAPLICAPANSPPNNIPISSLKIRFGFNDDCTKIKEAYLEGCITLDAADRICMCPGLPGACARKESPSFTFDPNDLIGYCHNACGDDWISFGGLLRAAELKPTCITPEGVDGYRVQGYFDAEVIPSAKFNPISSDDCQQTGGTP